MENYANELLKPTIKIIFVCWVVPNAGGKEKTKYWSTKLYLETSSFLPDTINANRT